MKNLIRIPENKEELKALWAEDKKKIIGGAVAVGAFIAGAIFAHDKLKANDGSDSCCDDTAGYLPEDCGNDEDYQGDPDDEEETEDETDENEADAE